MNMTKPRSRAGLLGWSSSIAVAAGPDEVVALAALGLDQAGIDRRGKARIVQLDGEIFALRLAGGLLPGCTKIRFDRDRGEPRGSAPPTPPYVRVRIRRFEK